MAKAKYKNKSISTKKYIIALFVVIGIIFIVLYINKWQQVKEDEKYFNSYLITSNTISLEMNEINQISSVLSETPNYYFVYISYTKDKDVYNLEKKLKPLVDEYNLKDNFYFINVTDIKDENKNYKDDIAQELNVDNEILNKVPIILYFKDGSFIASIHNANEFEDLLEKEDIKSL